VALMVALVTYSELHHLLRLRRARALQPGQRPKGEVAVGGTVVERTVAAPSGIEAATAAWQMSWANGRPSDSLFHASPPLLEVQCEHGQVLVDLQTVAINMESDQHAAIDAKQGRAIATQLGLPAADDPSEATDDGAPVSAAEADAGKRWTGHVRWLVPGQEVFVVGLPRWEGGHGSAGYRDGSLVPVFRDEPEHSAWLADHGEAEASTRARWSVTQGVVWGLLCALIAAIQLTGLAD